MTCTSRVRLKPLGLLLTRMASTAPCSTGPLTTRPMPSVETFLMRDAPRSLLRAAVKSQVVSAVTEKRSAVRRCDSGMRTLKKRLLAPATRGSTLGPIKTGVNRPVALYVNRRTALDQEWLPPSGHISRRRRAPRRANPKPPNGLQKLVTTEHKAITKAGRIGARDQNRGPSYVDRLSGGASHRKKAGENTGS